MILPFAHSSTIIRRHHISLFVLLLVSSALALVSCGERNGYFELSGRLANFDKGELYIYSPDGAIDGIDTIHVEGGKFSYERPCEREALLILVFPNFSEQPIFSEPGEAVTIKGDASHLRDMVIEGTKANDMMTKFRKQTVSNLPQEVRKMAAATIKEHPESPICAYLIRRHFLRPPSPDYTQAAELVELMKAKQPQNGSVQNLDAMVSSLRNGAEGQQLGTFNLKDDNGGTLNSQDLRQGLVAISIWSSWNYESQDQQRRLRGIVRSSGGRLKAVSISVDANKEDAQRILERDSINWTNANEDKFFESDLFKKLGVGNVPDLIIVRDGRIIDHSVTVSNMQEKFDQLLK